MKLSIFALCVLMLGISCTVAASPATFTLRKSKTKALDIRWRGDRLISYDFITFFGEDNDLTPNVKKISETSTRDFSKVINSWDESSEVIPFRKEVGLLKDGSEIEINIAVDHKAFQQAKGFQVLRYGFKIPLKLLEGMKFTALGGRSYRPVTYKGIMDMKDGRLVPSQVRYVAFEGNGKKLAIDFNPIGPASNDTGPGFIVAQFQVFKKNGYLRCFFGILNTDFGGLLCSKIRIFEGSYKDYLKRHAFNNFNYYSERPIERAYSFGARKRGRRYTNGALKQYSSSQGYGWLDNKGMKRKSIRNSGAAYTAAIGSGTKTFRTALKRPGLYILTARFPGYKKARGPFSLTSNGKKIASDLKVGPYKLKTVTWSQWIEDGKLDITLKGGDFAISSLAAQLLNHSYEDFKFRRKYWITKGYEPHPQVADAAYSKPVKYTIGITEINLPKEVIKDPARIKVLPRIKSYSPAPDTPGMRWRYSAFIGTPGPANGTFTEFTTEETISRRLKEIQKKQKVNTLLLNGLMSRHTYPSELPRVEQVIAKTVEIGHRLNMKILDHQDLTLLWNMGEGYRVLIRDLDMTQHTVTYDLPNTGYCLNNEKFNKKYFAYLTSFIRNTKIDGIMIDEAVFHKEIFCGCATCRKKFTEATGLTLPVDETSPLLMNPKSVLWKSWLAWRLRCVNQWVLKLRRHVAKINPLFCIMRYTTHYGYASSQVRKNGMAIDGTAINADFIGTEIMSANSMAAYRAVFAFRKAKNAIRTAYGSAMFGLVYGYSDTVTLFGWILNNMNAQATWLCRNSGKNFSFYHFRDNMNKYQAEPVSDIAILYSTQTRDWETHWLNTIFGRIRAFVAAEIGHSQIMSDRNIQNIFIIEPSLKKSLLKNYKLVIVDTAKCLSDKQIKCLLDYAKTGGTLYVSGNSGTADTFAIDRKKFAFTDAIGVNFTSAAFDKGLIKLAGSQDAVVEFKGNIFKISLAKNSKVKVLANVVDASGKIIQPLAVRANYGKGSIVYSAASLCSPNYEPETTYQQTWKYKLDKALDNFANQILQKALDKKELSFKLISGSRLIISTVYRQIVNGKTSTMVNLLNVGGTGMKIGKKIPSGPPSRPVWPKIKQDIVFDISIPACSSAYAVSIDYPERKDVTVKKIANGRYRVTLPEGTLQKYSIIYLNH